MGQITNSTFVRYKQSPEEALTSCILNLSQKEYIQNLICDTAEQKLALELDPYNPLRFTQQEAGLAGQLSILRYLLESSAASELILAQANSGNM